MSSGSLPSIQSARNSVPAPRIDHPFRALAVCLVAIGALVISRPILLPSASEQTLRDATSLWLDEKYAAAEHRANDVLQQDSQSSRALIIAGESAIRQSRDQDAIRLLKQVPDDGSADAVHALCRAGQRLMAKGYARDAEDHFRRALGHDPAHLIANRELALLLQLQGRTWESIPFVRRVLLAGNITKDNLLVVGASDSAFAEDDQYILNCLESDANNSAVLLVRARQHLVKSRLAEAEELLRQVLAQQPELVEAQARLGRLLFDRGAEAEWLEWHRQLPHSAESHPEIWHTRGLWARRNGQMTAATRCFLESVRLDPNHKGSVFQLSQLLNNTKYKQIAKQFAIRSQRLAQLHYLLMEVRFGYDSQLAIKIVDLLGLLERQLEAAGWCEILKLWSPNNNEWADAKIVQLYRRMTFREDLTGPAGHLASQIDVNEFPLPHWPEIASTAKELKPESPSSNGDVRFANVAADVGIDFQYFNGTTKDAGLIHILQATGGGIAVIDYDVDGWPDLYFIQSGPYPVEPDQKKYFSRLFRNLGNGRFQDVTESVGLANTGFGQGAAVGDYNNDGFPDLYVANFGGNRLYENTGTGHFIDVTELAQVGADRWSTSCMIADLNGDTLPEIYVATYSLKDEVLKMKCEFDGKPRTCPPTVLTADEDILYQNRGDGTFVDVTQKSGIIAPDGKGLGVVAADFQHRGQLDIFVANDTSANFLFRSLVDRPGGEISFNEAAIGTGVGFNEVGQPMANMGLAVGDANGDGLLDAYVTTYYGEANVLYIQNRDHSFTDATRQANLRESSLHMLGFGAQFIDGELDGRSDLIIANGHIDFTFAHGNPDRMAPQYVRNVGEGRFVEMTSTSLGPYFCDKYFGRALAKLDWNRDGREDVCISHLDAPAALLQNTTTTTNRYLAMRLCGVESSRDAIGAIVTIHAGKPQWVQQVLGGGGYFASNESHLLFGLSENDVVDQLTIQWPSGLVQTFQQVDTNQQIIAVEGNHQLAALPGR